MARFTPPTVRKIRRLNYSGWSSIELARRYCVTDSTIRNLVKGRTYANIRDGVVDDESPPALQPEPPAEAPTQFPHRPHCVERFNVGAPHVGCLCVCHAKELRRR